MTSAKTNSYSVLLVDDDAFLLDMYAIKFKEHGSPVQSADSADAALKILRGGAAPDIILLDLTMPVMDGFDLLEVIKKEGLAKKSTIIILSNLGQPEQVNRALNLGAEGYIVKSSAIPSEVLEKALEFAAKSPKRSS